MKIRIIGNVLHDNVLLKEYEVYDLDEESAKALIESKNAKAEPTYPDEKVETYTPMIPKKDEKTGMIQPGQLVEATEEGTDAVKGVEPKSNNVKGGQKRGKK